MQPNTAEIIEFAQATGDETALLQKLYGQMVLIRTVEQTLLDLFSQGLLRGTVHTCLGQEAIAAGIVGVLDRDLDAVCSNHRGHGHFLAYCGDVRGLIAEIMGKSCGVCGGRGGSQHLHRDNFYSNGILGGMAPVAAGIAMAEKAKASGAVTVVFHGDGAMAEGVIYETLNIAALWRLPILFAIEHNQVAQSTPIELEIAGALECRAVPFGIPVSEVDGNDVLAVHAEAGRVIGAIRDGQGPRLMLLRTYRLGPHSKGDDDRDPDEIARHRARCPITRAAAMLDPAWCDTIARTVADSVAQVVDELKKS